TNVSVTETMSDAEKEAAITKMSGYFTEAYTKLRSPQIFARYENFDFISDRIKQNFLPRFDQMVKENAPITKEYRQYLEILLDRRAAGSKLGRNTMIFFFILSLAGLVFWMWEKKSVKKEA
ncbi:MAG TPA: hypothetical protein PKK43_11565, partial [Spirochaetota bacterium]|nr:hypothetical protein [Spirochaetota bacterium]